LSALHLRERWIYATRPAFSIQLAVRLAEIGMAISLGKVVGALLLGVLLAVTVPQLIHAVLPGLIESLLARFPGAGWVETLVGWLSGPLMEWLIGPIMKWLHNALGSLLGPAIPSLFAVSVLVFVASKVYKQEQVERYRAGIREMQRRRQQGEKRPTIG